MTGGLLGLFGLEPMTNESPIVIRGRIQSKDKVGLVAQLVRARR